MHFVTILVCSKTDIGICSCNLVAIFRKGKELEKVQRRVSKCALGARGHEMEYEKRIKMLD